MNIVNTIVAFIVCLGILIFVHELGHFLFAKLFKVRVLKFSLGFGPKIYSKKIGETEYQISALPLGGFVKMFGENPDEQKDSKSDKDASFAYKTVWQRFLIVLAGPVFNLVFTVVLFFLLFFFKGLPDAHDTTKIGVITENSPAAAVGMMVNDTILAINDHATEKWQDVVDSVKNSRGEEVTFLVLRGTEEVSFDVTPAILPVKNLFGEVEEERYLVGIQMAPDIFYVPTGMAGAFSAAYQQTWMYIKFTGLSFKKLAQRVVPFSELGGPILIAQIAGKRMQDGLADFVFFMGLISVNLGLLNLLPIPVLDGGHLMFLSIEAIRRKPMSETMQIYAQQVGMAFLGILMIFVFYNDLARIFKS